MIDIYDISGTKISNSDVLNELLVTKDCQHVEELMKANYVKLSWEDTVRYELPVGAYIIPFPNESNPYIPNDQRYPLKYKLFSPYIPEAKNIAQYGYEPEFQHPVMWLSKLPMMFITGSITTWADALKKTTWGYTGSATQIASFVVNCINWIATHDTSFGNTFGTGWVAMVDTNLAPNATITFDSVDIMSGASAIAQAFDCEFHFDFARKQFRLGEIRYGTEVTLETGINVGVASVNRTKTDYHNAFLIKGGTKNLSQPTDTGENLQLTERLTLEPTTYPDSTIYTDNAGNIVTREQFVALGVPALMEELIFDDVYPKLDLYLYNVRERKCWLLDENGHKVEDPNGELDPTDNKRYKAYSKWYTRLAYPIYTVDAQGNRTVSSWVDYHATEDKIIEGQTLQITFLPNLESGAMTSLLIGQGDFDAVYFSEQTHEWEEDDINPAGFTAEAGDYRIVQKEVSGLIIPTTSSGGIYPQGGLTPAITNNKSTLLNIVVDDTYKVEARQDLEMVAKRKVSLLRSDLNNYNLPSNPVYFEANNTKLHIGQAVIYNDGQATPYTLSTHVLKIVTQLDYPFAQEITVGNQKVKGDISTLKDEVKAIMSGGLGGVNEYQLAQLISSYGSQYFLSKLYDDSAQGFIRFFKGIQIGKRFTTGLLGEGGVFRTEEDDTTYIEADRLYVRMKAYFDNVEIRDYRHSAGNTVKSVAGMKCCRVEYIGSSGTVVSSLEDAVLFRCYFRGSDGEDEVRNNFVVGDMAYHHVTDVDTVEDNPNQKGLNQSHYWRLVVGRNAEGTLTADGEHWIDLSNRTNETLIIDGTQYNHAGYQSGSDVPSVQDDIIQLGNINDTDRQGAIIEFVTGGDAPSYQIFQGINDFGLTGKNKIALGYNSQTGHAYLNVYGDAYFGDPNGSTYIKYEQENSATHLPKMQIKAEVVFQSPTVPSQETTLEDFATAITDKTEDLQRQIDGEIESWFYAGVPTLLNAPANTWDTTEKKDKHLGDLYYDKNTGYGYRFVYDNDNEVYMWTQIYDDALVEALRLANEAQDTADHKRRVFLTTPTPPYDAGDLWVNAVWPASGASQGATYNNDILKCVTSKTDSESFAIADWTKASKYTDDSQFETYINQILNGTNEQTDPAVVAQALHVIKGALNQDTNIVGGLMLTTLIGMRDSNGTLWGGMNGQYDANAYGGGLASWYGGGMIDKYNPTTQQFDVQNGAKIGFRFNGSGYVAGGAIAWDATGLTNVNVSSITAATINLGAEGVATQKWVGENYISIAYFDRLFRAFNGDNLVNHNDTQSTINNIKAMFGFWTDTYLSALGNSSGSGVSLTLANMGDVQLSTPTNGQALIYNATTQKWVNQTISATGNYLPITGGTLTGDLFFEGYNNRVFGIKRTSASAGQDVANNIDVGWDYQNRDGAGAFFRSVEAGTNAGDFGFFARNATNQCELVGKPDGTLTWGNNPILTSANIKTINGQSIYGTGNISVGGTGGDADTVDGYHASSLGIIYTYSIPASGCVRITFSDRFAAIISVRKTNQNGGLILIGNGYGANRIRNTWTQLSPTTSLRWSVPASDSIDKAIEIQNNSQSAANVEVTMLNPLAVPTFSSVSSLYSTGNNIPIATADSNVASATKLETSRSLWGQSFDGTADISGAISNAGDITPSANASYNLGSSSLWWNRLYTRYIDTASGYALRLCVAGTERVRIATGGNVGIGTTSPSYKLHVNGTLGAGNITGANIDSEGYISALSDIRKKDVVEYMDGLTIEQIAKAPIIKFTWIDRPEEGLQVGSVAQYWEKVLPQSVHTTPKGFLSFAESRAALVGTISNSRELVKHEKRIAELERENRELKIKLENVAQYGI